MTQALKLKVCKRSLGITLLLMLASGIQLEVTEERYAWSVWLHIVLGISLTALAFWHVSLYYKKSNWFSRFATNRKKATRILWWVFLVTAVTGIVATVVWLVGHDHSPLGAIHGKIGFVMVIAAIFHHRSYPHKKRVR